MYLSWHFSFCHLSRGSRWSLVASSFLKIPSFQKSCAYSWADRYAVPWARVLKFLTDCVEKKNDHIDFAGWSPPWILEHLREIRDEMRTGGVPISIHPNGRNWNVEVDMPALQLIARMWLALGWHM